MPRLTAAARKAAAAADALAAEVAAAILARPFDPSHSPDSPLAFANLAEPVQAGIAEEVFADYRLRGKSADDCRERFGGSRDGGKSGGLTGPRRRKLFLAFGYPTGIARSYVAYSDGEPRKGSAHASQHGALAAERQAAEAAAQAEAEAAALAAASKAEARKAAARKAAATRKARKS